MMQDVMHGASLQKEYVNLDFETIPSYSIAIEVQDKEGASAAGVINIEIVDRNEGR